MAGAAIAPRSRSAIPTRCGQQECAGDQPADPPLVPLCSLLGLCSGSSVLSLIRVACFADSIRHRRVLIGMSKVSVLTSDGMGKAIMFRLSVIHPGAPGPAT